MSKAKRNEEKPRTEDDAKTNDATSGWGITLMLSSILVGLIAVLWWLIRVAFR